MQLVPHLDFELIAEHPKAFLGYSDITALHVALRQLAGLATFYGPHLMTMGWTEASDFTRDRLLATLRGDGTGLVPADPDDPYVRPIRGGRATGPLAGGDLWLLLQTMGTPWELELEGAILFFEEVDAPPWYVDGMLTQLEQAGKLAGVAGVAVGDMARCDWSEQRPEWPRTKSLEQVLEEHLEPLGVPVLYQPAHRPRQAPGHPPPRGDRHPGRRRPHPDRRPAGPAPAGLGAAVAGALVQGRSAFAAHAWADAYERLSAADREAPLEPGDLERLATAAYLVGRDDESAELWARAHHELLGRGETGRAARCAFWLAFGLLNRGESARGGGWVARARRVLADAPGGPRRARLPALAGRVPVDPGRRGRGRPGRLRGGGHRRRPLGRARPGRPGPRGRRPGADPAGPDRPRGGPAGRGDGGRRDGRAVADGRRRRLLQRARGLPGAVRPAPGPAVDGRADQLVRHPAGPGPLPRPVPAPPGRAAGAPRRLARRHGGGQAGLRPVPRADRPPGGRGGRLPAGRAAPAAGRGRRGRGGLPPGQPLGPGAAARPGPAAAGPGTAGDRPGGDPPGPGRGRRPPGPGAAAARGHRDRPGRRRPGRRPGGRRRAGRGGPAAGRAAAAGHGRLGRRRGAAGRGRPPGRPGRPAERLGGLAGAGGAVRGRQGPGRHRPGLPGPWRPGLGGAGAGRGPLRLPGAGRRPRPGRPGDADRPGPGRAGRRPDAAGGPGAAPGRHRAGPTGPSPPSWC